MPPSFFIIHSPTVVFHSIRTPNVLIQPRVLNAVPVDKDGSVTTLGNDAVLLSSSLSSKVSKTKNFKRGSFTSVAFKHALSVLSIISTLTAISSSPLPAYAAKKVTQQASTVVVEHLHTGQKIANYFRSFGIPDLAVLAIISAMPVVELRGAVPVGVWMGLPITTVLPVCVLGNMIPIVPILFLLRNDKLK